MKMQQREECVKILLVCVIYHHCQTKKIRPTNPNFLVMFPETTNLFFRPKQGTYKMLGRMLLCSTIAKTNEQQCLQPWCSWKWAFGLFDDTVINKRLTLGKTVPAELGENVDRVLASIRLDSVARSRCFRQPRSSFWHIPFPRDWFEGRTVTIVGMIYGLVCCQHWRYTGIDIVEDTTPLLLCLARKNLCEFVSQGRPVVKLRCILNCKTQT